MDRSSEGRAARQLGTIVEISTVRWAAQANLCWVLVRTSAGALGLGETYYLPGAVESVVHDLAAPLLIGRPAGSISAAWNDLFACTNFFGFAGAEMRALSALDTAMWDALGQATELPVHQLLGGQLRPSVPVYNTCVNAGEHRDWDHALEDAGSLAKDLAANGFLGMKLWPWDRFAPQLAVSAETGPAGWGAMGSVGSYLPRNQLAEGLSMLEAARAGAGPGFELLIEGHSRWDVNSAIRIARAAEPIEPLWMEDICQPDSAEDLARLVRETRVPQAVSERLISRYRFREVLAAQAAHVILVDLAWTGGLSEGRQIAQLAALHHLPFSPHDCTGPVTALANVQLAVSQPNCIATEVVRGFLSGYYTEVIEPALEIRDGHLVAPTTPGLGARLRSDFITRSDVLTRRSS